MTPRSRTHWVATLARPLAVAVGVLTYAGIAGAQTADANDPRVGLEGGHWVEAGSAISNLELVTHVNRPQGFFNPNDMGDFGVINSDLAFTGNYVFQGNFHGIQIWDVSDIRNPVLKATLVCPGGQGDPSIYGNLMFMSVEETRGRVDCGAQGVQDSVSPERFRGVRIFDISDITHPKQVAAVQTCRGSHTHTLLPDPVDKNILYVYVQGTSTVRPEGELAGCSGRTRRVEPQHGAVPHRDHSRAAQCAAGCEGDRQAAHFRRRQDRRHQRSRQGDQGRYAARRPGLVRDRPVPRHHGLPSSRTRCRRVLGEWHSYSISTTLLHPSASRKPATRTSTTGTRPRSATTART